MYLIGLCFNEICSDQELVDEIIQLVLITETDENEVSVAYLMSQLPEVETIVTTSIIILPIFQL